MEWGRLEQDSYKWRFIVNIVTERRVVQNAGVFLTGQVYIYSFLDWASIYIASEERLGRWS